MATFMEATHTKKKSKNPLFFSLGNAVIHMRSALQIFSDDNNEQRLYHRKGQLPLDHTTPIETERLLAQTAQPQGISVSKAALRKMRDLGNLYAEKQMLYEQTQTKTTSRHWDSCTFTEPL